MTTNSERSARPGNNEKGVALVITLFLMAALSSLAVSLMFLAQTETSASRNYKTMSQARYAGEAGVHKAMNYLMNTYPATAVTGSAFNMNVSPVTATGNGNPVVLSSDSTASNYPDSAIVTAFAAAATGTLATGVGLGAGTVTYNATARLVSMRDVGSLIYGGNGTSSYIMTWQITASGTISGAIPATVEVTAMLERNLVPAETFSVFATDDGCGALTYSGSGGTDSYDSGNMTLSGGFPVTQTTGGAIGTNGNLDIGGSVTINGTLSTPRTGVGSCEDGAVSGATSLANVTGGMIQLPQAKAYPDPEIPPNNSTLDWSIGSGTSVAACNSFMTTNSIDWTCSGSAGDLTIEPNVSGTALTLRNVDLGANAGLTIGGSGNEVLNWNSFEANGSASFTVANMSTKLNLTGAGLGPTDPVMDFAGGFDATTAGFDSSKLQIMYAGTGEIKLRGNNELSATVYAPNAHVTMASSYAVYGSILAATYENTGGALVHYDRALATKFFTFGNYVMSSFSWKKY